MSLDFLHPDEQADLIMRDLSNYTLVATLKNPTPESVDKAQNANLAMTQGNKGVLVISCQFSGLAANIEWIANAIGSAIESKGVSLWRKTEVVGGDIRIYFEVGYSVIAIVAIVVGCLMYLGIAYVLVTQISIYKLNEIETNAKQNRLNEQQQKALKVIEGLSPEDALKALEEWNKKTDPNNATAIPKPAETNWGGVTLGAVAILGALAVLYFWLSRR